MANKIDNQNQNSGAISLGEEKNKQTDAQIFNSLHHVAFGKLTLQHCGPNIYREQ